MSLDTHMAFERQQPSLELRAFLDPLKPGSYFDCGRARLSGIDEALEAEAVRRGRDVGHDDFQLVATSGGLIFCRASISFAIAARWKDLTIGRPTNTETDRSVLLPIQWPTHGDLEFTVSRRLGSNVFRRWLQIQAQMTRRSQLEQNIGEPRPPTPETRADHDQPTAVDTVPRDLATVDPKTIDLRGAEARRPGGVGAVGSEQQVLPGTGINGQHASGPTPSTPGPQRFEEFDRGQTVSTAENGSSHITPDIAPVDHGQRPAQGELNGAISHDGLRDPSQVIKLEDLIAEAVTSDDVASDDVAFEGESGEVAVSGDVASEGERGEVAVFDDAVSDDVVSDNASSDDVVSGNVAPEEADWSTFDEELLDSWVDDRPAGGVRHTSGNRIRLEADDDPTADPFEELNSRGRSPAVNREPQDVRNIPEYEDEQRSDGLGFSAQSPSSGVDADRFTGRGSDPRDGRGPRHGGDPSATYFMPKTASGTSIYPSAGHAVSTARAPRDVSIPEIEGARLQHAPDPHPEPSSLNIRSAVLAGAHESPLVELMREKRVPILVTASILALILLVIIGIVIGGDESTETGDLQTGTDLVVDSTGGASTPDSTASSDQPADQIGVNEGEDVAVSTTTTTTTTIEQSALVVSTPGVQICHSNYGGCVPVAADVDCEGDGDGPAFQADPVAVFGDDVYDLDTDGDRQACEPDQPAASASSNSDG